MGCHFWHFSEPPPLFLFGSPVSWYLGYLSDPPSPLVIWNWRVHENKVIYWKRKKVLILTFLFWEKYFVQTSCSNRKENWHLKLFFWMFWILPIFRNTFFTEHSRATPSALWKRNYFPIMLKTGNLICRAINLSIFCGFIFTHDKLNFFRIAHYCEI